MNKIIFSRHAKKRLQLYEISEEDIVNIMGNVLNKSNGQYEIVDSKFTNKYKYPLKIIYAIKNHSVTIITAYPLKKELKNENTV